MGMHAQARNRRSAERRQVDALQRAHVGEGGRGELSVRTVDPNVGSVNVPDARLDELAKIVSRKRTVPAAVEFVDIAGLVKGASQGEGLGNQFLANIRETDAIVHVVRCFDDDDVLHVMGCVDPVRDREVIEFELALADLSIVEKRLDRVQRAAKTGDKEALAELPALERRTSAR